MPAQDDPEGKETKWLRDERLGTLRIGMRDRDVHRALLRAPRRGPDEIWAADGLRHQTWSWPGIALDMVAEKEGAPRTVASVTVERPSSLKTRRGIHVGSTENEVARAYRRERNPQESVPGKTFVAGSVFGGLLFTLAKGRVTRIFLGAAAE